MAEAKEIFLLYDENRSGVWNFYRQLFGKWPDNGRSESSYTEAEEKLLGGIVWSLLFGTDVQEFYGLGVARDNNTEAWRVKEGLKHILETKVHSHSVLEIIQAAYDDLSSLPELINCEYAAGYYQDFEEDWTKAMMARIRYLEQENARLKAERARLEDDDK